MSLFLFILFSLHLQHIYTIDVAESNTGAVLAFPSVLDGPLYNQSYLVAPAQFGYQQYGGSMEGVLILPTNTSYHKECPSSACNDCAQEPLGINPYIHYINDWFLEDDIRDFILVIDRLDCYFVDKIEWAQKMGASGVVMCDWKKEHLFTMWMPPDFSDDIHIPSVLLQKKNCMTLMEHLGVKHWDPTNIRRTIYPSVEDINWTIATIEWGLPHDDDKVEWELWTSSNDYVGSQFKHNFNTTAIRLDKANDTIFTPHMYILNGSHWGCPSSGLPCKKQCSNSGRYCAVDPEYDLEIGLDGIDVIQENLRSLCVWEYDKLQKGVMDDVMWWDYAVLWDENCGILTNNTDNFHSDCSFAQMDKLDTSGGLSTFAQNCILSSGGYDYRSGVNKLLKRETKLKYNSSIYALPMIRVNEFLIHGNMDCELPVTVATCEVLAAICAGFMEGTAPDVCYLTPAPTIAVCNETDKDCSGSCFGSHAIDACGACLVLADARWNECIGCNAKINESYDCAGTCGGHYTVNPCGYCKDSRIRNWVTFGVDCNGTCSTELREDECGECLTASDVEWNACVGCDNIAYSKMAFNPCGRCIDSTRDDFATFGADCNETCDGDAAIDACGVCISRSNEEWNLCVGCDGIPHSNKSFNECGSCIDKHSPDFNNYGKNCRNKCASAESDEWSIDECAQCLPVTDPNFDNCCGGDPNKSFNECGLCLLKSVSDFNARGKDCNGSCNGIYAIDACGACLSPTDEAFDACIKCGRDNNMTLDCNDVCGGSYSVNDCGECIDYQRADFNDYGKDCSGICNGAANVDDCGKCLNTTSSEWNACVGCDNRAHSKKELNPCNVCILNTRTDFESYGMDCAGICGGNRAVDDCGECLESSDADWNSCIGCDDVQHSNMTYNECGACVLETDPEFDAYGRDCTGNCANVFDETHYIDECGECLLSTDDSWNACLTDADVDIIKKNDTNTKANNTLSNMVIIISVSAFVLLCCAVIIIVYLCRKHVEMKRTFDEIKKTYQPMDDITTNTNTQTQSKIRVPDNETD